MYTCITHAKKLNSSDKDHLDSYTIPLLSPGMVSLVRTLPEYSSSCNSFKACTRVYVNRARLFCDLLLSHNKTFSLQDAKVSLICLDLRKPLLMWLFKNIFNPFSVNAHVGCF